MASEIVEESATQLFSKFINVSSSYNLEEKLFPSLRSNDVVEIYGESGSGKTEILYHFIVQCILPQKWKDLNLNGLDLQVIFIDNDCHFNLFRLISIIENRLKTLLQESSLDISSEEISLLIRERLKFIEISKCYDSQQFLMTLCSLESLLVLKKKSVIMIDGITSFYWGDKMRMHLQYNKFLSYYSQIYSVIKKISQNVKIPIFTTRRKLMRELDRDKKILGQTWKNIVTWHLELTVEGCKQDGTIVALSNITNTTTYHCMIGESGFEIIGQKEKHG